MELPSIGSLEHATMLRGHYGKIHHVYKKHGSDIMTCKLKAMHVRLGFIHDAARVLVHKQGLDSPDRLRVLSNVSVDDICSIIRKSDGKNANSSPDRGCRT